MVKHIHLYVKAPFCNTFTLVLSDYFTTLNKYAENYKNSWGGVGGKQNTTSLSKTECAHPVVSKASRMQSYNMPGVLSSKSDSMKIYFRQSVPPDLSNSKWQLSRLICTLKSQQRPFQHLTSCVMMLRAHTVLAGAQILHINVERSR